MGVCASVVEKGVNYLCTRAKSFLGVSKQSTHSTTGHSAKYYVKLRYFIQLERFKLCGNKKRNHHNHSVILLYTVAVLHTLQVQSINDRL